MRIWTLHPQYLDTKGLLAAWREGLLAQKVLRGETRGYTRHPQLRRLQAQKFPVATVANYLREIAKEADARGYNFDRAKISERRRNLKLIETRGQLLYEWSHLKRKLRNRSPKLYRACCKIEIPKPHPLFRIVSGPIAEWEKRIVPKQKSSRATESTVEHGRSVSSRS